MVRQRELWGATASLPKSIGHRYYEKLNGLLLESGFDRFVEELCAPYHHDSSGRPSIPPGTCFQLLLVGDFEGIDSQRGIAWPPRAVERHVRRRPEDVTTASPAAAIIPAVPVRPHCRCERFWASRWASSRRTTRHSR